MADEHEATRRRDEGMQNHDDEAASISWRLIALGASSLVITLGGVAIGLWSSALDQRLAAIALNQTKQWEILNQRSGLAPRLDTIERDTADQEQRLRALERQVWGIRR